MCKFAVIPTISFYDKRLSSQDIAVLGALAIYANKKGVCTPSNSTIANIRGVTRQSIQKSIRTLCACGYLMKVVRFRDNGGQTSNSYNIVSDHTPENRFIRGTKESESSSPPLQPPVAPPATPEVAPPATSEVAPIPLNTPIEHIRGRAVAVVSNKITACVKNTDAARLLAAYHQFCPSGKKLKIGFAKNNAALRNKIIMALNSRTVEEWDDLFAEAERSDFLTRRCPGADGERFNGLSLGWLLAPKVADAVAKGRFRNRPLQVDHSGIDEWLAEATQTTEAEVADG